MKKLIYLLILSFFVFTSCEQEDEIIDVTSVEGKTNLVEICRYNPGTDTWETVSVPEKSLKGQLNNPNAYLGPCKTYVPDDNFERLLICLNIDTDLIVNDSVLTSDIINVQELFIPCSHDYGCDGQENGRIFDFTGIQDFIGLKSFGAIENGGVSTLDLTYNIALVEISLYETEFVSIDLPSSIEKISMGLTFGLESLDLSTHPNLTQVLLDDNYSLTMLNLQNGYNTNILYFHSSNNLILTCIQVDNKTWADANWSGSVNPWVTFSEDCGY